MGLLGVLLLALDMEGRRALPKVTGDGRLGEGEGEGEGEGDGEGEGEGEGDGEGAGARLDPRVVKGDKAEA